MLLKSIYNYGEHIERASYIKRCVGIAVVDKFYLCARIDVFTLVFGQIRCSTLWSYTEINLFWCSYMWDASNKLSGAAGDGMIDGIYTLEYHSYSRFVGFHRVYRTITLCDGRVILKLIYLVFISMGDTSNKLSGAAGIEIWTIQFTRQSPCCAYFIVFTSVFHTITLLKCWVILKLMYSNVALCETHRIRYCEWKEVD